MRLRRRIQLLFVALFVVLVAGTALDALVENDADEAAAVVNERLVPARDQLQLLLTSLVDQETGQRGYLLTGRESFLQPFEEGKRTAKRAIGDLHVLLADDPDALAGVDRVRSRADAWQQLTAEFEIAAKRDRRDEVVEALVASGTGKNAFEAVRTEIADLRSLLGRRLQDEQDRVDTLHDRVEVIRFVNVVVAFLLVVLVSYLLRRWVTRPLGRLSSAVRSAASGALRQPIEPDGPPDLAELAADVDAMRQRLLAEVDDATRARAALADRGLIVVAVRDDLAPAPFELPAGIELAARFRPAQGLVAGDWYDVVRLDDGRVVLALVDVSGHGAEVATYALRSKALTMAAVRELTPGDAFAWVADRLGESGELFLTGVIAEVSASTGRVRYASAGHPPMLLAGIRGVAELGPTGPLLGPLPGHWSTGEAVLDRGGVLVAYSDGVIEARDATGDQFGPERLTEVVVEQQLAGVEELAGAALAAVSAFGGDPARDDLTLCVIGR